MVTRSLIPGERAVREGRSGETPQEFAERVQRQSGRATDITQLARSIGGGGSSSQSALTPRAEEVLARSQRATLIQQAKRKVADVKRDIQQDVNNLRTAIRKKFTDSIRGISNRNERLNLVKQNKAELNKLSSQQLEFIGRLDNTRPEDLQAKSISDIKKDFLNLPGVRKIVEIGQKKFREEPSKKRGIYTH